MNAFIRIKCVLYRRTREREYGVYEHSFSEQAGIYQKGNQASQSTKDFRWMIQSNQIKNYKVTVRDIDVAHEIWGKEISAPKVKTTRSKPTNVAGDLVKIPREYKLLQSLYLLQQIFSL